MGAKKQGDAAGASTAGRSAHNSEQVNPPAKKQQGSYTNWFVQDLWPHIEAAVKQHQRACMMLSSPCSTLGSLVG
jgi:hypothetical protein